MAWLLTHAGKTLTHGQLLKEIWGASHVDDSHYVHVYMRNLRQKLEVEPSRPKHFITEQGVGYRFVG